MPQYIKGLIEGFSCHSNCMDIFTIFVLQIYDNAMIAAGLIDDPRTMLNRMNDLLAKALAKH